MNRQHVSSSDLRSVGYDPAQMILEIEFNSGGIYQYLNVPETAYAALMKATSKGRYFHAYIKEHYKCDKIS